MKALMLLAQLARLDDLGWLTLLHDPKMREQESEDFF